jgi:Ca2+-binding EF-hand superfamily protein
LHERDGKKEDGDHHDGPSDEDMMEVENMFYKYSGDPKGGMTFKEWHHGWNEESDEGHIKEKKAMRAFRRGDRDGDDRLSVQEFKDLIVAMHTKDKEGGKGKRGRSGSRSRSGSRDSKGRDSDSDEKRRGRKGRRGRSGRSGSRGKSSDSGSGSGSGSGSDSDVSFEEFHHWTGAKQYKAFKKAQKRCGGNKGDNELQHYFNKFATLDRDGFAEGYRMAEGDHVTDEMIDGAFKHGDRNGDGRLSYKELRKLAEDMNDGSGSDSGSDSDSMDEEDLKKFYHQFSGMDGEKGMSIKEFETAWLSKEKVSWK